MKRMIIFMIAMLVSLGLFACGSGGDLADMQASEIDGRWTIQWEGRSYMPFCVVEKSSRGRQLGYVNGDPDDRVSAYGDCPPEDWLVSWIPTDGGALLYKEAGVTEIPPGLQREYP